MDIFITAAMFICSLSMLVILHEGGHFFPAKLFGMKVEKFYLFFDWKFSLIKKKIGNTVYGIGWIPLGGYVKISGMIDESMDKEQMKQEPKPWEFRSKPAWQRLIVMIGGVTVNVIVGLLIYIGISFSYGENHLPLSELKYGLDPADSLAIEMGMKPGDVIVAIDGEPVKYYDEIGIKIIMNEADFLTVERDGSRVKLPVPFRFNQAFLGGGKNLNRIFMIREPLIVDSIREQGHLNAPQLEIGDQLLAVNDKEIFSIWDFHKAHNFGELNQFDLTVKRSSGVVDTISAQVDSFGRIGFDPRRTIAPTHYSYSFLQAIPHGIARGYEALFLSVKQLPLMFSKKSQGYKYIRGPLGMAKMYYSPSWNWEKFWRLSAFISMVLAFMNLLPIPALDGGHVLFLLFEMISGKTPSDRFLEYAQLFGFVVLMGLMLLATGNDVISYFN